MVGTGPFVMTKFVDDQYIEGTANPDYFLGKPKLDKIVFQITRHHRHPERARGR